MKITLSAIGLEQLPPLLHRAIRPETSEADTVALQMLARMIEEAIKETRNTT